MPEPITPKYRHSLPQLGGGRFLTDGGLETTLIFHEGWQLPMFEAFTLLESVRGRAALSDYYGPYIRLALEAGVGFVLDSPTGAPIPIGRPRSAAIATGWRRSTETPLR